MAEEDMSFSSDSSQEEIDTVELKFKIIDEYKPYPILYDKKHPDHFWCDKKLVLLQRIADKLGISGACKLITIFNFFLYHL